METNLKKGQKYKLTKAPSKNPQLQRLVGGEAEVKNIIREKNHRAFEVLVKGMLIGLTTAELRAKTFVFEKVTEPVAQNLIEA